MKAIVSVSPAFNEPLLTTIFPVTDADEVLAFEVKQPADLLKLHDHLLSEPATVLVLYSRAEYAMAALVRAGWDLDKAAEHWQALIRVLLDIQKTQRQRVLLLDGDDWLSQPERWPERCLAAGYIPDVVDVIKPETDLVLLACCQYVRLHTGIIQLNTLLQASSLPVTAQDSLQMLPLHEVLHQHFLQQQRWAQLQDQLAAEQLLVQQQKQQLHTAERQIHNANQLQKTLEQSGKQCIAELQSSLQQAQQLQVRLQQENELLLTQLHQVQEQLESTLSTGHEQVQNLQRKLADTEVALSAIQKSYQAADAKLKDTTQQLASAIKNDEIKAKAAKTDDTKTDDKALRQAEQENALLLDQLFKVQEQLEDYYLQLQHQKQQSENTANVVSLQHRLDSVLDILERVARDPALFSSAALEDRVLLLSSPLFDPIWYQQQYMPAGRPTDSVDHYLTIGSAEGFHPGPDFDATDYLAVHQDVAAAALDPLLHFERHGRAEGRQYKSVVKGVN